MNDYQSELEKSLLQTEKALEELWGQVLKANEKIIQISSMPEVFVNRSHRIVALALTNLGNLWGIAVDSGGHWYTVNRSNSMWISKTNKKWN